MPCAAVFVVLLPNPHEAMPAGDAVSSWQSAPLLLLSALPRLQEKHPRPTIPVPAAPASRPLRLEPVHLSTPHATPQNEDSVSTAAAREFAVAALWTERSCDMAGPCPCEHRCERPFCSTHWFP